MACYIAWCAFTWEAFATLATGLAAVGGATHVGRKQVAISKRQTAILNRQVELEAHSLRSDLFDRRYVIFEATEKLLRDIVQSGDRPENRLLDEFRSAMSKSRLLFHSDVYVGLTEILSHVLDFDAKKNASDQFNKANDEFDVTLVEREDTANQWLSDRLATLPELFEELNLGSLAWST
jgi:hypothetical protein